MIKSAPVHKQYHYIFAGAGCASLSLLLRMLQHPSTQHKRILLADRQSDSMLGKTWCFWEKDKGFFEDIVYRQYQKLAFHGDGYSKTEDIAPWKYKMIRGKDFYHYCMKLISQSPNVEFVQGNIDNIDGQRKTITVNGEVYQAEHIFNSIVFQPPVLKKNEHMLLQHFKGWFIETEIPAFDPGTATLMDFRIPQQYGASFVYIMPFSEREALVEYTVFSGTVLKPEQYDEGLNRYIQEYIKTSYSVTARETGIIPMTNYRWPRLQNGVINLGTAGGQTKASSGYTFQFIQHQSDRLARQLINGEAPVPENAQHSRFHFYDAVLLEVLAKNYLPGEKVFTRLFKGNSMPRVLNFLANQSTLTQELRLISGLPKWPFIKAALHQVFR